MERAPSLDVDLAVNEDFGRRSVLDVFVPVNDVSLVGDIERPLREARQAVISIGMGRRPPKPARS